MSLTTLLDQHFPKQELAVVEYAQSKIDTTHKLTLYKGSRVKHVYGKNLSQLLKHEYEVYGVGDHDYPFARASPYEILTLYDVADTEKVRAFMSAYVAQAEEDDLRSLFEELFCC